MPSSPAASAADLVRLLRQAAAIALLRRPREAAAPLAPGLLFVAFGLHLVVGIGIDAWVTEPPRGFEPWVVVERSFPLLLVLLAAWLVSALAARPALWLRIAAIAAIAALPAQAVWVLWSPQPLDDEVPWTLIAAFSALLAYAVVATARMLQWADAGLGRIVLAAPAAPLALLLVFTLLEDSRWWWTQWPEHEPRWWELPRDYSAEDLLYAQPARVDAMIQALAAPRAGTIDLYAVGFGGDGHEGVFRNEVEYLDALMTQRFGLPGHTVTLVNHPHTLDRHPLATMSNLRRALAALGRHIDAERDIVWLFLTSHGSPDHALDVVLHDLPLDPVTPEALRTALDDAGIRWRVVLVSACYSGGFVDALRDPHTLVITAARHDRPSFGCGVGSEITWFGQAYLVDALNATLDFVAAFDAAAALVEAREREQGERPSHPQIEAGEAIAAHLQRWLSQQTPGPAVEFVPAVPAGDGPM